MAKLTNEQKKLLESYRAAKKALYESDPDASVDRHDTILNWFNRAKRDLIASGYPIELEDKSKTERFFGAIAKIFVRDKKIADKSNER